MTVLEMVKKSLKTGGFDGLYSDDRTCACELNDLAPCGEMGEACCAGYKHQHPERPMEWAIFPSKDAPDWDSVEGQP